MPSIGLPGRPWGSFSGTYGHRKTYPKTKLNSPDVFKKRVGVSGLGKSRPVKKVLGKRGLYMLLTHFPTLELENIALVGPKDDDGKEIKPDAMFEKALPFAQH